MVLERPLTPRRRRTSAQISERWAAEWDREVTHVRPSPRPTPTLSLGALLFLDDGPSVEKAGLGYFQVPLWGTDRSPGLLLMALTPLLCM